MIYFYSCVYLYLMYFFKQFADQKYTFPLTVTPTTDLAVEYI